MPRADAVSHTTRPRRPGGLWCGLRAAIALLMLMLMLMLMLVWAGAVSAQVPPQQQPVEVVGLSALRGPEAVSLDYQLRVTLPPSVEDAARRGVPLYFVATASVWQPRWYWRDKRVARERREWRLTFQPLTSSWRVSQGGLGQSHTTLTEAMAVMTRSTEWRLADAAQIEADGKLYVEFEWQLDTTQLPRPLQIGLTSVGGASDWTLNVERTMRVETLPAPAAPANGVARPEPK